MNLNKAQIIGRITQDLELKTLPNGNNVLNFSVATNYNYKTKDGEKVETTEFHNVVSFGKQAEVIKQYFVKGQEIYCEGRLQTRNWEDKDTKKKMYRTEINLEKFEFGAKPNGASNFNSVENNSQKETVSENKSESGDSKINYPEETINPEDIPF